MDNNIFKLGPKGCRKTKGRCVKKVCKYCGKEFYVSITYGKGDYCSKECSNKSKIVHHKPNVICAYCGKPFYKKPSQIKLSKEHCCSKECMGKLRSVIYKGENNPNYNNRKDKIVEICNGFKYYSVRVENHPFSHTVKGGAFIREHRYVVEQNYNLFDKKYFIVIDNKYYLNPKVDVHHKNEITTDNRIENLEPLFRNEHTSKHNKRKIIIHYILSSFYIFLVFALKFILSTNIYLSLILKSSP